MSPKTLSPAYEMDDFQPVAILQTRVIPLCPRNNFTVQLHRYPVTLHAQLIDQFRQCTDRSEGLFLSIDEQSHASNVSHARREQTAMLARIPSQHVEPCPPTVNSSP